MGENGAALLAPPFGSSHQPLRSISAANADPRVSVRLPSPLDRLRGRSAQKEAFFRRCFGAGGRGEAMPADIDP